MSHTFIPLQNQNFDDVDIGDDPPPLPPRNRRRFYRFGNCSRKICFFLGLAIGVIFLTFGIWAFMHHEGKIDVLEKFHKKSAKQIEALYNEVLLFHIHTLLFLYVFSF